MCVYYHLLGMSCQTTVCEAFQGQDIWKKNYYYYSASLGSCSGLKVKLLFYTTSDRLMWTVVHDQSSWLMNPGSWAVIMNVHDLGSHRFTANPIYDSKRIERMNADYNTECEVKHPWLWSLTHQTIFCITFNPSSAVAGSFTSTACWLKGKLLEWPASHWIPEACTPTLEKSSSMSGRWPYPSWCWIYYWGLFSSGRWRGRLGRCSLGCTYICTFNSILNTLVDFPMQTFIPLCCCAKQFAKGVHNGLPLNNVSTWNICYYLSSPFYPLLDSLTYHKNLTAWLQQLLLRHPCTWTAPYKIWGTRSKLWG